MAYPWTFFTKNFSGTPPSDPLGWRDLHMRVKGVCPFEHTKNHFPGIRINQIRYGVSFIDWSLCKNTQFCNTINHYDAIKVLTWYYFVLLLYRQSGHEYQNGGHWCVTLYQSGSLFLKFNLSVFMAVPSYLIPIPPFLAFYRDISG